MITWFMSLPKLVQLLSLIFIEERLLTAAIKDIFFKKNISSGSFLILLFIYLIIFTYKNGIM